MTSVRFVVWVMTNWADAQRQSAFLLHSRPYRETSALVDLFTESKGRVRAVVRGARRPKSRLREILTPFTPIEVCYADRNELKNLRDGEVSGRAIGLQGRALWCGLYLNELLVRLLPLDMAQPRLFALYGFSLQQLMDPELAEPVLRIFERRLLEELGFAIDFDRSADGQPLVSQAGYRWIPGEGFFRCEHEGRLLGSVLLAIGQDDYHLPETRKAAKWLMRRALAELLGERPLNSRALFSTPISTGERIG